jgi:hypothetical protein
MDGFRSWPQVEATTQIDWEQKEKTYLTLEYQEDIDVKLE